MTRLGRLALPRPRLRPDPADAAMFAIALGHGGTHWYLGAFAVILPYFQRDLGLSTGELGLLLSLRSITSAVVNLPAGTLVDVIGRRFKEVEVRPTKNAMRVIRRHGKRKEFSSLLVGRKVTKVERKGKLMYVAFEMD